MPDQVIFNSADKSAKRNDILMSRRMEKMRHENNYSFINYEDQKNEEMRLWAAPRGVETV
jgi:hypothetical protein